MHVIYWQGILAGILFFLHPLGKVVGAATNPDSVQISFTAEEKAYLAQKGTLRFSVDPAYLPFEALDKDGRYIGIASEVLSLISKRGNVSITLVPTKNWAESLQLAQERKIDFLPLASSTQNRRVFMDFTSPYIEVQAVVATLMQRPYIDNLDELNGKKVGIVRGYSHIELLRRNNPGIVIVEIEDYHQGLLLVQNGELYGVAGNMASIGHSIQAEKMSNIKIAGRIDADVFLCIASRNDEPILAGIMEKLVKSLRPEEVQEITNRWWGVRYEHATDYSLLLKVLGGFIAVAIGIAFWLAKLRQLNNRLQLVNRQLEELNTQKDYYFSVIGHDLRNPFMAIMGYSSLLKNDLSKLEPAEISKMAGVIHTRSGAILEMLNQLLEWARLELNQFSHESTDVDLHLLAKDVFALYEPHAAAKQVALKNDIPVGTVIKVDSHMISSIVRNLVSNALKYSPAGKTVSIQFDVDKRVLSVKDEGIGMTADTVSQLFSLKPRKSVAGTANEHGTGLGLTICNRYARELGAVLTVSSKPDEGSVFSLTLP